MLRRGMGGAAFCICSTFSSSVMRATRAAARSSAVWPESAGERARTSKIASCLIPYCSRIKLIMRNRLSRRGFLAALSAVPALAETNPLKITAVEVWQLRGHRESVRGIDQQYQANPLHVYDELRPKPYAD